MAKQKFKKRGGGNKTEKSTFETSEETTEVPEIEGVMKSIDKSLRKSENVKVKEIRVEAPERRRRSCCWD